MAQAATAISFLGRRGVGGVVELSALPSQFEGNKPCQKRKESIEEMEHADKLVVRIIFLEGFPNLQLLDPLRIGQNVKEVLDCDLAAEISARTLYQEAATYCHTAQGYVTRDPFEKLMADEEHHIDFLETQLDLVSRRGLETLRAASYRQDERERRLIALRYCGQDARLHGYGFTDQISHGRLPPRIAERSRDLSPAARPHPK
jgi:bacterioferritin